MRRFTADESAEGLRADIFLAQQLPEFTRSSLSQLFERGLVRVNRAVVKPGRRVRVSDKISIDDQLLKTTPHVLPIPIIYEDNNLVVVDKPAGVLTHSKGALNTEATIASSLRSKIDPELSGNRAGIVHRLDRGTSGVMVVAKNPETQAYLQKQFSLRHVAKIYKAVVEGVPSPEKALIDAPIARNPRKPQTFMVKSGGKTAQTEYSVGKIITRDGKQYALVELKPLTGRTHQLRIHLKYINHPIVGDPVYGHGGRPIMLHASCLAFDMPGGGRRVFESPLTISIKEFLDG